MRIFLGIEATNMHHSMAVASDETGQVISWVKLTGRPISLHTTAREVLRTTLFDLVSGSLRKAGLNLSYASRTTLCIGLTGVTFPYDAHVDLPSEFRHQGLAFQRLICTGDAEITFASHTQSPRGSLLLSHMGSTAYIVGNDGQGMRFGGWGPVFGDKGSGFSMGREVLRTLSEERDRNPGCTSKLWTEICDWLDEPDMTIPEWKEASIIWKRRMQDIATAGYDPRTALFSLFHEIAMKGFWNLRLVVSGLVIPLMRAWANGCSLADRIVQEAARDLCEQYEDACSVAAFKPRDAPIVFYGGILAHNSGFRELVIRKLGKDLDWDLTPIMPSTPTTMRPVLRVSNSVCKRIA